MKVTLFCIVIVLLTGCCYSTRAPQGAVLNPGESIVIASAAGTITCSYVAPLQRKYLWSNVSRIISLNARDIKWYGALGIYSSGTSSSSFLKAGDVTRIVAQESMLNFDSLSDFLKWEKESWVELVYNDEGYAGGWSISPNREQLNVDIWRIFINGKAPRHLPGAKNSEIRVSRN